MVSPLPNKIYLRLIFYGYRMNCSKNLEQNLDTFNKLQLDLYNTRKKFDDEDVAVILLIYLLESFEDVKTTIKYGRDSLSSSIVINVIKSRDFETRIKRDKISLANGKGLFVRGRP